MEDKIRYEITVPDTCRVAVNAETLAGLDEAILGAAQLAFGTDVQIARTYQEGERPHIVDLEVLSWPEIQAKLDQPIDELLTLEALGISTPRAKSDHTRILNRLAQGKLTTARDLYIAGKNLERIGLIKEASLLRLREWLGQVLPEMPYFAVNEVPAPEYVAQFCSDLSHIRIRTVLCREFLSNVPGVTLADYEESSWEPDSDIYTWVVDFLGDYIARFKAARAELTGAGVVGAPDDTDADL